MNQVKVSVNIPIYNVEKYLRQCLDSMVAQTLKEIEFILIDDGSTDSSSLICDEYAAKDSRFKVFHKSNGGSASARQMALDQSSGEYIIVCDADDWAEPTMYETLYELAKSNNTDISSCDYYINYDKSIQRESHHSINVQNQEILIKDILVQRIPPASFVKMVRRNFILENNIRYTEGVNLGEDYLIFMKMALCSPSIIKCSQPLYHYRRVYNGKSYTNSPNYNSFLQLEFVYYWFKENLDIRLYHKEIFQVAINVGYLGIRVSNMNITHHKQFIKSELPLLLFLKYKFFNLKSLMVLISKISRPISLYIYTHFNKYFYKK